eukprot:TRINITY_DN3100_c0_g1_i1.p1 TRINITY_DN3100_c0_g1~~TRINITY_DN3100_c0_g1_i1.p1  ORF type:complete len:307 (-),score=99.68 TRINITY_DN3100_c0_g1_i1:168-1088(-)
MAKFFALAAFMALSCSAQELKFVAVGDWGGQSNAPYTTSIQLQVAAQMGETAAAFGSQFTLGIGDNFYDTGINGNDHNMRFNATFSSVYTAASLQSRWYFVAGNHDHNGNVTAQVEHTHDDPRWYFPSPWYTESMTIPGTSDVVQFVFFDSVVFTDVASPAAIEQLKWIDATLKASTARFLLVVAHYPVWSIGSHGPTPQLVDVLRPLLIKYHVDAYFCGHDHNLQHIDDNSGVDYFLTGAGHAIDSSNAHKDNVPRGSSKFFWGPADGTHGGFITVGVNSTMMSVDFYSDEGQVLYSAAKKQSRN